MTFPTPPLQRATASRPCYVGRLFESEGTPFAIRPGQATGVRLSDLDAGKHTILERFKNFLQTTPLVSYMAAK
jgi:hypothetical protein